MTHLGIVLMGKVQRIGLRYQIKEYADELGLNGYARNLREGTVFIEVEGDEPNTTQFLEWLKLSPGLSEVKKLEMSEGKIKHYGNFQIY